MASIGSLEVSLSLNASNFNGTVSQVNRNMKAMGSELQAIKAKGSEYENSLTGLSQKQNVLSRSFDAASIKLQEQRRRYDELVASGTASSAQIERQANAVNQAQAQYNRLERELAEVTNQLRIQSSQWTRVGQSFQDVGNKMTFVGNGMKQIGQNMSMYVTAPLAAMGAGIVKVGMDFDSQMSKVSAVSGATGADFEALRAKSQELGATTKFTATQVAEGMEYLALAGFKTNQILGATEGMLNLAAAAGMDLGMAADITSDVMSAFGMKATEAGHAADVFAYAQANANTNVEQMGEAMKYVAPMANQMGWSLEETSAAMMKLADNGLKGSIAGQAFASSLGRLAKPTKKMNETMDELGLSFFDANDNMKSLPDIIAHLEDRFEGLTMKQKSSAITTLFGAEAYKHWAILLESGSDILKTHTKSLENADGTAKRMADTMVDNLGGSILMLKSALEGLMIQFSDLIKDDLRSFAEWLTKITGKFAELDDGTKKTILVVGALAAAIGPVLIVGGALISSIGTIVSAVGGLSVAIGAAGGATTAFGASLALITGPVGWAIGGIALLTAGGVALYKNWDTIVEKNPQLLAAFAAIAPPVVLAVGAIKTMQEAMNPAIEQVDLFADGVSEGTKKALGGYLELSDGVSKTLSEVYITSTRMTEEIAAGMAEQYAEMNKKIVDGMKARHQEELSELENFFMNSSALSSAEEEKILANRQARNEKEIEQQNYMHQRINEIYANAAAENREITERENEIINNYNEMMKENAVRVFSESELEQKVILERMKENASIASAEQAAEVVKNAIKQKDEVVKEANETYDKSLAKIIQMRDETGEITAEQAEKMIAEATKAKDQTISLAEEQHQKIVETAQKQADEHVGKVNWETGEVVSKWDIMKSTVGRKAREIVEDTKNKWEEAKKDTAEKWEAIKSWPGKKIEEMKSSIEKKMGDVKTIIETQWKHAQSFLENVNLVQVGKDIINGLIKGLNDMMSGVKKKVEEIGNLMSSTIRKVLGIASPSKKLTEVSAPFDMKEFLTDVANVLFGDQGVCLNDFYL